MRELRRMKKLPGLDELSTSNPQPRKMDLSVLVMGLAHWGATIGASLGR